MLSTNQMWFLKHSKTDAKLQGLQAMPNDVSSLNTHSLDCFLALPPLWREVTGRLSGASGPWERASKGGLRTCSSPKFKNLQTCLGVAELHHWSSEITSQRRHTSQSHIAKSERVAVSNAS